MVKCLVLKSNDNVGILVDSPGRAGDTARTFGASGGDVLVEDAIPKGHKMAVRRIRANEPIIKFGQTIGVSTKNIRPGEHVHVHNVGFSDEIGSFRKQPGKSRVDFSKAYGPLPSSFRGYLREDGRAGTRNYVVVASTVNCSAVVARAVARHFRETDLSEFNVDGIVPITHASGCAQKTGGASDGLLNKTIAGWLYHPNVVGAVVIGLGCEDVTVKTIASSLGPGSKAHRPLLESLNIQDAGGTAKAVDSGIEKVEKVLAGLPARKRAELPASLLTVALNCGGSDAFSAITANPALGIACDVLASHGGTIVLGETPECFGAENLLAGRCASKNDRKELRRIFADWRKLAQRHDVSINDNLASGNVAGGISTILEKSWGALSKGGSTAIKQVLRYADRIGKRGLIFMDTPGFDPVSVTGLVAGGCNVVAFTTGNGSVYGCPIAPTIKISTNSALYERLRNDMDIDAGKSLAESSLMEVGREIYDFFIQVAGGARTCAEKQGLEIDGFVPWQLGETL